MQVKNPRVESHADDRGRPPVWDGYETVYGRMRSAAANEKDGIVQHLLDGEQLALQFVAVPDHLRRIQAEFGELFMLLPHAAVREVQVVDTA